MGKILGRYRNGNYTTTIYSDGTKVRENDLDCLIPMFAENADCHITNKCDGGCQFCYAGCTPDGKHADLLGAKFIDTLHPYTELAINGNDMSHPQLVPFLEKLREKRVIANLTVMQMHFEKYFSYIRSLVEHGLIHGLGVSLRSPTPEFVDRIKIFPNAVIHVINGIFTEHDYEVIKDAGLKLLILGYKNLSRGEQYLDTHSKDVGANMKWLYDNIAEVTQHFNVVSFDNLALEQLDVKRLLSDDEWNEFYMGDDGDFTFYIDMVNGTFANDSMSSDRYPIMDNVDDMFKFIREKKNAN